MTKQSSAHLPAQRTPSGANARNVTINDIARIASVSKKTVSRVINKSPLVREDTRLKVEAVIDELGFTPDPRARALAFRRSFLIGMIYNNPSPQYVVNIQRGIHDALSGTGHLLVLQPIDRGQTGFIDQIETFVRQQKPRGVILTPSISEDEAVAAMLKAADCPYVRVASVSLDDGHKMVRTHDHDGGRQAARHLAELGHVRIAHVHGPSTFRSTHERRRGFEEGLAESGLSLEPELTLEGAYTFASGVARTTELLEQSQPPTGIFLGNDEMAVGAYRAIRQKGLRIPEDISVVGYDDTPMASRVWPAMTTVRMAIRDMAAEAARLLLGGDEFAQTRGSIEFSPELIVRDSTRGIDRA